MSNVTTNDRLEIFYKDSGQKDAQTSSCVP